MLSVTDDELCMRRFHFILLVIQPDSGKVVVMGLERYGQTLKRCSRGNFNPIIALDRQIRDNN